MNQRLGMHLLAGVLFAFGLAISGMTQPQKVIGFLDLANGCDQWTSPPSQSHAAHPGVRFAGRSFGLRELGVAKHPDEHAGHKHQHHGITSDH